jgi:mannose-6-phosphate isomerase-like protein (cupin superfamily)
MGNPAGPEQPHDADSVRAGRVFRATTPCVTYRQRFTPDGANLLYLACAEISVPPAASSDLFFFPGRESLLFAWKGEAIVELDGGVFVLQPYDILYVPLDSAFTVLSCADCPATLIHTSAPAANRHPVFHSRFAELSQRENRQRRLKGKTVYLMFDVSEAADKLVAGYTFFEPFARSWPPHNHTDQEEAYIFLKGRGAMEVYHSPETLTFVHGVAEGDIVTIPFLNYHPVFSQDEPLEFIWCIAGERYWVGDKNKDFMTGAVDSVTT